MTDASPMTKPRPKPGHPGQSWCEVHNRWECPKRSQRRPGDRCHATCIRGTDACKNHAGKRRDVAKAQGAAITAWTALSGVPEVSASDAVLGMLHMSWLRVHLYAGLLREQVEAAQVERDGGTEGVGTGTGLVGQTMGASPSVGVYATGEAVRALAQLEAQERDRCVRYAKTAHDMGIAEQQILLAERQGAMLAAVFARFARLIGRDPGDVEVQRLMQRAISEEIGVGVLTIEGSAA